MATLGRELSQKGLTPTQLYQKSRVPGGLRECGVPEHAQNRLRALLAREFPGSPPCVLLWLNANGELLARWIRLDDDDASSGAGGGAPPAAAAGGTGGSSMSVGVVCRGVHAFWPTAEALLGEWGSPCWVELDGGRMVQCHPYAHLRKVIAVHI